MLRARCLLLAIGLAVLTAGCASPYSRLVSEDSVAHLASLKALTAEHPNRTTMVETGAPGEPPLRVAVHEVGDGSRQWTLILLHGMFTDHTSWRFVQGALAEQFDLWVIDLPGCGDSDAPPPDAGVYEPTAVARRVLAALRDRMDARPGPARLAIVGHSYGGLVALRMFGDSPLAAEYSDVLGRVERIVLISPVDVSIHRPDPVFLEIASVSALKVRLGLAFGVVQDKVAMGTLCSVCEGAPALREEAEKRLEILRDSRRRGAMQALLRGAVPTTGHPARPDWAAIEALEAGYARVSPPTLILWGRRDETVPISMGYKIAAQLPNATLAPIDRCMHSVHMEQPELFTRAVAEFIRTGEPPDVSDP